MGDKAFYDILRPTFRGSFSDAQFDGIERIKNALARSGLPKTQAAYVFATAHHETGRRMQPIREGFCKTNAGAVRAVAQLYAKGVIRTNYGKPDPETGQSYYGRGLVQITWKENYAKVSDKFPGTDFVNSPDDLLDWKYALPTLIEGMREGIYRRSAGRPATLKRYIWDTAEGPEQLHAQYVRARNIINGDVRKNGSMIADYGMTYYNALLALEG